MDAMYSGKKGSAVRYGKSGRAQSFISGFFQQPLFVGENPVSGMFTGETAIRKKI